MHARMHACIHTFTNIHTLRLPDIACPDITHHDIIHADITHRDIIHPDITHRDIIHPDIIHPDIIHCDINHPDIIHQDIIRLDITNPYPSMIISHSTMQMSVFFIRNRWILFLVILLLKVSYETDKSMLNLYIYYQASRGPLY